METPGVRKLPASTGEGWLRTVDPIVRGLAAGVSVVVVVAEANCIIVVDGVQGGRARRQYEHLCSSSSSAQSPH